MHPSPIVRRTLAVLLLFPVISRAQAPAPRATAPGAVTAPKAATPVPPSPPLVDIHNLTVRDLRVAYIRLDSAQSVQIEAVGAEPQGRGGVRRFLDHGMFQSKEDRLWDKDAWPGNAWILDARTRCVAWELRLASDLTQRDGGLASFGGNVRLPAGTYEIYYSSLFPVSRFWDQPHDWRVRGEGTAPVDELHGPYLDDGSYHQFRIAIWAKGQKVTAQAGADERDRNTAFVITSRAGARERAGFEISRPVTVELYGVGEKTEGNWNDYGWVRQLDNQRVVWSFRNQPSRAGGGAAKNREVRDTVTLEAGKYLAYYAADDSHHAGDWNETPPHDPAFWGLAVRVLDPKDRAGVKPFEYRPVTGTPIVQFIGLKDEEFRSERFTLLKPLDVHIFAIGEGAGRVLSDRGWLVDSTGRAVWRMQSDNTIGAGGSTKNRLFDGTVRLEAGAYTAYFVTDGSHSAGSGFNTDPPQDPEYWGITITAADASTRLATVVTHPGDVPSAALLARINQVGDDANERGSFRLAADGPVRIAALGEGSGRNMSDYGWIEDAKGETVWRMEYDDTEPAGGSSKNRRVDAVVRLKAGAYTVRYLSDGSHAFGSWNATMPDDPLAWGITVTRVR